jgi:hypothetical protein
MESLLIDIVEMISPLTSFKDVARIQSCEDTAKFIPSSERRVQLNGLHGVISQKMLLFITTAVKTSNPTFFPLA